MVVLVPTFPHLRILIRMKEKCNNLKRTESKNWNAKASMRSKIWMGPVVQCNARNNTRKPNDVTKKLHEDMKVIPKWVLMSEITSSNCSQWYQNTPAKNCKCTMVPLQLVWIISTNRITWWEVKRQSRFVIMFCEVELIWWSSKKPKLRTVEQCEEGIWLEILSKYCLHRAQLQKERLLWATCVHLL